MAATGGAKPATRRSAANLTPAEGMRGNRRAVRHGAYAVADLEPLRDAKAAELRRLFPHCPDELLSIQATRAAQLERLWQWISERDDGLVYGRRGEVTGAASLLSRISSAYENAHARLAEIERQAKALPAASQLEAIAAELADDDDQADGLEEAT